MRRGNRRLPPSGTPAGLEVDHRHQVVLDAAGGRRSRRSPARRAASRRSALRREPRAEQVGEARVVDHRQPGRRSLAARGSLDAGRPFEPAQRACAALAGSTGKPFEQLVDQTSRARGAARVRGARRGERIGIGRSPMARAAAAGGPPAARQVAHSGTTAMAGAAALCRREAAAASRDQPPASPSPHGPDHALDASPARRAGAAVGPAVVRASSPRASTPAMTSRSAARVSADIEQAPMLLEVARLRASIDRVERRTRSALRGRISGTCGRLDDGQVERCGAGRAAPDRAVASARMTSGASRPLGAVDRHHPHGVGRLRGVALNLDVAAREPGEEAVERGGLVALELQRAVISSSIGSRAASPSRRRSLRRRSSGPDRMVRGSARCRVSRPSASSRRRSHARREISSRARRARATAALSRRRPGRTAGPGPADQRRDQQAGEVEVVERLHREGDGGEQVLAPRAAWTGAAGRSPRPERPARTAARRSATRARRGCGPGSRMSPAHRARFGARPARRFVEPSRTCSAMASA